MPRYFLSRLQVEGFRGINNSGQPLDIKFRSDKLNSIFATNGLGKSSLFEALSFAIFGDIRKLTDLHSAEDAHEYYCNRFHPTQSASITLTLEPEDGAPAIEVEVRRTNLGLRSVNSPTGHSDPEGLLESLRSDLVLLDQHTFARFLADSPLARGRSFSALVGLAQLSEYRQVLETISNTRTMTSDLGMDTLKAEIAACARGVSNAEGEIRVAFRELVASEPTSPLDVGALVASSTAALSQVTLLSGLFVDKDLRTVDFGAIRDAIKKEEEGEKREDLSKTIRSQAELEGLAPVTSEGSEQAALETAFKNRETALSETKGPVFQAMLSAMRDLLKSEEWTEANRCPACESSLAGSLENQIQAQLGKYAQVDESNQAIRTEWGSSTWVARLRKLEESAALGLPEGSRQSATLDVDMRGESPKLANFEAARSLLGSVESKRAATLAELSVLRTQLEDSLPPSLVQLTEQVEHGSRLQQALARYESELIAQAAKAKRLEKLGRWGKFVNAACDEFSKAEVALSTARTTAIESQYRAMYKEITQNPEVVPTLQKDDRSESLLLRLERFYGLEDLSAPTLLQESYRNALAISIFLSTAISHTGPAKFVVLDDVTSSFDAGHQWHLMELLRNKIARPANTDGPQVIVLSHDGLLEKYFDRMASEGQLHHQRLQGSPPNGFVLTQTQDANRLRTTADAALQAGQVDKAFPLIRQYLEYVLISVIRSVQIPVPVDFSIRDDRKMVQSCLDSISAMVDVFDDAGSLVLTPQQKHDMKNVVLPSLVSNWVSHYSTASTASVTAHALLGVLSGVDTFADCFKYNCTCSGPPHLRFYRTLTSKRCSC